MAQPGQLIRDGRMILNFDISAVGETHRSREPRIVKGAIGLIHRATAVCAGRWGIWVRVFEGNLRIVRRAKAPEKALARSSCKGIIYRDGKLRIRSNHK